MMQHDELDQLSAYLDGELDQGERERLEAHLPTCAECRISLDALRLTLADLATLPEPAPSEQDSWALRVAISRARTPAKRWQRYAFAAGTAAAAVIAFVAFVQPGSGRDGGSSITADSAAPQLVALGQNFDKFSAQEHLLQVSGKVPAAESVQVAPGGTGREAPTAGSKDAGQTYAGAFRALTAEDSGELQTCVDVVRSSTQEYLEPFRYEAAEFDGTPAFFLIFRTAERYELWVMSRDPKHRCDTLFFSQTR
jgi:putative zinc finger protein